LAAGQFSVDLFLREKEDFSRKALEGEEKNKLNTTAAHTYGPKTPRATPAV
jgi:hypothetical protein